MTSSCGWLMSAALRLTAAGRRACLPGVSGGSAGRLAHALVAVEEVVERRRVVAQHSDHRLEANWGLSATLRRSRAVPSECSESLPECGGNSSSEFASPRLQTLRQPEDTCSPGVARKPGTSRGRGVLPCSPGDGLPPAPCLARRRTVSPPKVRHAAANRPYTSCINR